MFEIVSSISLDKSIKSIIIIALILLVRKRLNEKSIKHANMILWSILFMYLIFPYSFEIVLNKDTFPTKLNGLYEIIEYFVRHTEIFIRGLEKFLYRRNRFIVAMLLFIYLFLQIIKTMKTIKSSVAVKDERINEYISRFNLKRKIEVLINDNISVPITYGIIKPKIVLQSKIFEDDTLLKYVMIHELTHIKKYDVLWNHLKYFIACIHWHNIFVFAACKYIEDDLEMLCDKLVIKNVGDTEKHKKEYLESMFKLVQIETANEEGNTLPVKLHPTLERMKVMSKYGVSLSGILILVIVSIVSLTAFTGIRIQEDNKVISSVPSVERQVINEDNRTKIINNEEYERLIIHSNPLKIDTPTDIDKPQKLDEFDNKEYSFNINSDNSNGFSVKLSNMTCKGEIDYEVIILEDLEIIYREYFDRDVNLAVEKGNSNNYKVIVKNGSHKRLSYQIEINSYIK